MDAKTIIIKKRQSKELTRDEIRYFIAGVTKGDISDAQFAALISYIYTAGLTESEILHFCVALADSGEKINLSEISNNIVLKHSTGGVGDKSSLILMPVMASLGLKYPQVSNRGFGVTGALVERFECIPGFDADLSIDDFKRRVAENGVAIMAQNLNLAPAEAKLFKIRTAIGASDSLPLVALSLMSMKLASGGDKFVFDITCGKGTYIKTKEQAKRIAHLLIRLGKSLNKETRCVITSMDEPIGYAIGQALELKEVISSLRGSMPQDLGEKVVALGSVMLALGSDNKNLEQNANMIREVIKNGQAYNKFIQLIKSQYGNLDFIENPDKLTEAYHKMPVFAEDDGFVEEIDTDMVGSLAHYLGAGRMKNEDLLSRGAGILLTKKIGDEVKSGEVVAYVFADEEKKVMSATQNLTDAFKYTKKKPQIKSKILEVM